MFNDDLQITDNSMSVLFIDCPALPDTKVGLSYKWPHPSQAVIKLSGPYRLTKEAIFELRQT